MATSTTPIRRSALQAASCLKRYREVYELGLEDDSDESRRGTAFHRIFLEEYIPALVRQHKPADPSLLDAAFRRGIVAAQCPPHLVDEVEDLVFSYGSRFELDLSAYLEAEAQQVTGGVSWKPDLVFAWRLTPKGSVLRVEDLKTYHAILNEETVRREFQAQLYVRNAMDTWRGFDCYEFAMTFVRFGVTVVVEYAAEDLASLDRKVDAILATIEDARARDEWPAQPGDHCGFCRLQCDVADDPKLLDRRCLSVDDAGAAADRLVLMGRMYDADQKALKAWCTIEGPLRRGGLEWAHRPTSRLRYAARLVLDTLQRLKVPDPPGLTFSKSSLSKLFTKAAARTWPGLSEELEPLAITKTGTRFSAKKVGDQAPDVFDEAEE